MLLIMVFWVQEVVQKGWKALLSSLLEKGNRITNSPTWHTQKIGDSAWVKEGFYCGSKAMSLTLEGLEIKITESF